MVSDDPKPYNDRLSPPSLQELADNEEDFDEEIDFVGYEPLPLGPEYADVYAVEEAHIPDQLSVSNDVHIENSDLSIVREVWNEQRSPDTDSIHMTHEREQQVMLAMAKFVLPPSSIPDWAKNIPEEQWKQTLKEKMEKMKNTE